MKDIYQVIKNVRLSEKATMLQETNNEVVLEVDRSANKLDIKRAVETLLNMWYEVQTKGFYTPAAGVQWTPEQVKNYLEATHD